jgi:hypothetical protein
VVVVAVVVAGACSQTAGTATRGVISAQPRGTNLRRATETISRTFRIMSSSTRKFSTHDCTSSAVTSRGADLVCQLLHSMLVGAVEEFSVAQQI